MQSTRYSFKIWIKLDHSGNIFEKKYSNIRFNEIPSSGAPDVPCGRKDGQTDITKLIILFVILRKNL
jgi:hypothetical protein